MAEQHGDGVIPVELSVIGGFLIAGIVGVLFPADAMTHWLFHPAVVAGCCWAGQLWYVGRTVSVTPATGDPWRYTFGIANTVTLLRGGLYAVVAGFLVVPVTTELVWVPAACYGAGVVLDRLDGTVARTVGKQTQLGTRLDMAFDTFGFVVAPLVAVLWGQLPALYLSLSAARYVYVAGIRWRRYRNRPVFERPDSNLGKYLAGVQMAFITAALVPTAPTGLVFRLTPVVIAPSLMVFLRDFLVASGRLPREWFDRQR